MAIFLLPSKPDPGLTMVILFHWTTIFGVIYMCIKILMAHGKKNPLKHRPNLWEEKQLVTF